jgi:hypothetical protein
MKSSESTITCGFRFNGASVAVGIMVAVAGRGVKVSVTGVARGAIGVAGNDVDEARNGVGAGVAHPEKVSANKNKKRILIRILIHLIEYSFQKACPLIIESYSSVISRTHENELRTLSQSTLGGYATFGTSLPLTFLFYSLHSWYQCTDHQKYYIQPY